MNRGRLWVWPRLFKETAGGTVIEHACVKCGSICLATPNEREPMCGECIRHRAGSPTSVQRQRRNDLGGSPGLTGWLDREARAERERVKIDPPEPWPAPVVAAIEIEWENPATTPDVPNAARQMGRLGHQHGWWVKVTYARGTLQLTTLEPTGEIDEKTGKPKQKQTGPPKVVDSIAVRMTRGEVVAVAIWHDGGYAGGWITTYGPFKRFGANELKGLIRA